MKPILTTHLYLSLFLHIIIAAVHGGSPPIYTPVENIAVKCGFLGHKFNEFDNRTWIGDISSKFSPIEHHAAGNGNSTSVTYDPPHDLSVSYTTARLSYSEFTYRFNLTSGQKFIRFYFNSVSYGDFDRSKALFSVTAGGFTLLQNFNASVTSDVYGHGVDHTLRREFCLNIGEGDKQILNITFTPSPNAYAFINGIEIISMPTNLYYTSPENPDGSVHNLGGASGYTIENITALEMVYRINIGGPVIDFTSDTGMYRYWDNYLTDSTFLDEPGNSWSVTPENAHIELKFSIKTPNYTAPRRVYNTGRSMGNNKTINKSYNLTWNFPVHPLFYYLVRLHFCEFQTEFRKPRDRMFRIYIANQTAEEKADIILWSGGNGIPMYRDYLIFVPQAAHGSGGGSEKKVKLSLALQAYPIDSETGYNDALLNGLEIFKLSDPNRNLAGPNPDPLPPAAPSGSTNPKITKSQSPSTFQAVVAALVSSIVVVLSVVGVILIFRRKRRVKVSERSSHGGTNSASTRGSSLPSELCHFFSLAEIKAATRNFSDIYIIGRGGFGNVYKGYMDFDGAMTPVAVKRLNPESSQGAVEFKTEIEMLSHLRHRHLVSLIGYCTDEGEMILVYDYMPSGTLCDHLYRTDNPPLSWVQRLHICIGAAHGLHYLHTGTKYTIIHRDVKSTNILLDEKWVAKVSDFGLSKIGTTNKSKTHISTMVKGSFGYLDPEYYRRQQLTEKSDVYSFGVVLCEVLCARPALIRTAEKKQISLAEWARNCHRDGTFNQIIDSKLTDKIASRSLNKFVEIAVSCLHDNGTQRPSMKDVMEGLEFALELHEQEDVTNDMVIEKKGVEEVAFIKDMEVSGSFSTEQSSVTTNESIKGMSTTIFSEIHDSDGR